MASPEVLNIEDLLQPISDDNPTGTFEEYEAKYSAVADLASASRQGERDWASLPVDEDGNPQVPEGQYPPFEPKWADVVEQARAVITSQSKDLWAAAWLIEGLVREHGFAGLRDGCNLVSRLVTEFWGRLNPPFEEGGDDQESHYTVLHLSNLNSNLPFAIERIPLVRFSGFGPLNSVHYRDAIEGSGIGISSGQFSAAANDISLEVYKELLEDASEALAAYDGMVALLDQKCGETHELPGPNCSSLSAAIEDVIQRLRHLMGEEAEAEEGASADADGQQGAAVGTSGKITTREDAYKMLGKVADFFARTEPHSPVASTLKEVVSWRNLAFGELMSKLLEDRSARTDLFKRTGIGEAEED